MRQGQAELRQQGMQTQKPLCRILRLLAASLWAGMVQKKKQNSHNVLVSAWLLVPEFLDQRAQSFSLNPSFVRGPTMILLTLPSTSNSLASEFLPPSYSPWLDQPTFSPVTLTHNLVIHPYHQRTLYILYFIWKMLSLGFLRLSFT